MISNSIPACAVANSEAECVRLLDQHLQSHPRSIVLEVGCGTGETAGALAPRCLHWFGVDHDGRALVRAARRVRSHANVTLVEQPAGELSCFYDGSFDLVYLTRPASLHTPTAQLLVIQHVQRLLRPGGFCLVRDGSKNWRSVFSANGFGVIELDRTRGSDAPVLAQLRRGS